MKSAQQWLSELGRNRGQAACLELGDVQRIQKDAILLGAEICDELKETAGSLDITSKRQMAELCEIEIRRSSMLNESSSPQPKRKNEKR